MKTRNAIKMFPDAKENFIGIRETLIRLTGFICFENIKNLTAQAGTKVFIRFEIFETFSFSRLASQAHKSPRKL